MFPLNNENRMKRNHLSSQINKLLTQLARLNKRNEIERGLREIPLSVVYSIFTTISITNRSDHKDAESGTIFP